MLRPFLIIGVGGSGGKTLRGLRHALKLRLQQADWHEGLPDAWQLLHFDTPITQDGADYPQPFMPPANYKGLVAGGGAYESVFGGIVHGKKIPSQVMDDVMRQLPDPKRVPVDVTKGAGQFRAVGRAVALSKLGDIAKSAQEAINTMSDAKALGQLRRLGDVLKAKADGGVTPNPTVIVVSSIAGGSGAGQYLDVIEAIKATAKTHPWAYQFFSLLYAPDVFDQVKGSGGIPSNALATVAETMNGFWTKNPSESTIELFKSRGLTPSYGGARDKVGGAYPFIIGRQNSKTSFDNQSEVYSALATSISAWMTDDRVQGDIDEYATGNWTANVGANKLSDESRLMRPLDQSPPFSSLGFGRVTLGREKFLDYAAERFARSSVDRMLYWHAESDPSFKERTREEWIELKASWALAGFISAARLDEETEERNDVINALRDAPGQKALQLDFEKDVFESSSAPGSLDKAGGLDISVWYERLTAEYTDKVERYLAKDTANRQIKLSEWIASEPDHIVHTVEQAVGEHGLPVTVELLNRVTRVVKSAADTLGAEAELRRNWIRQLPSYIHEELSRASNQASIRPEQEPVDLAIGRIGQAFEWESEARLRECASALLGELRRDFIEPLRNHLASSLAALQSRVAEQNHSDGRVNEYEFWPRQDDQTVPRKYEPAPNERLLTSHTDYPREFEQLVSSAASGLKFGDAMPRIMNTILVGTTGDESVEPEQQWTLIRNTRSWKPIVTAEATHVVSSPQLPRFDFADQPEVYVDRARIWMLRQGTAFQSYITEDLRGYFDQLHVDPAEFKRRKDTFTEQLRAALGSSEPLVKLNPALLSEVHGKSVGEGTRLVFSSIPFEEGTEMYEVTKHALVTQGVWDDNVSKGWFADAKVDGIEIFAMSGFPYQPFVMDSVMEPIARGWLAESNNINSRAAFWKWKRSRLLMEAVPADPEVIESLLRGWYVAKALGQLAVDATDDARGPKLSVWDPEALAYAEFPHPLLYPGIAPSNDYPGIVLESLIVAMALVSSEGSLRPLRAYHVLMDLGGSNPTQLSRPLQSWIRDGSLGLHAPEPDADRAGSPAQPLAGRQEALRVFLENERTEFIAEIATQDAKTSVYNYPVSWEIRDDVVRILGDLRDGVVETKAAKSGI